MKTIHNSLCFDVSDVAKYRRHVLSHYYRFGWKSAVNAFGIKKSTLYDWKRVYEASGKKLASLIPLSTRPHQTRTSTTDWRLVEFIKAFREQYGNLDRVKIKVFLDEYAISVGLQPLSASLIGKIIRRRRLFSSRKRVTRKPLLSGIQRLKAVPKVTRPGYLQMDTITLFVLGTRFVFVCLIDVYTKYAFAVLVKSTASVHAARSLEAFQARYPHRVHTVQTDNGHEFLGSFHAYCRDQQITHEFIYPRSPRINGVVERFNRTLQEEFIHRHDELEYDLPRFRVKLEQYLHWYNTKRPHMSLAYRSPAQFMQDIIPKSA